MKWTGTRRIGQISGDYRHADGAQRHDDPQAWPLLNDTGMAGAVGFDLSAPAEHNGRLYFFAGDVKLTDFWKNPLNNSHLVAWTADHTILEHGGHDPIGFNFSLSYDIPEDGGLTQAQWRQCDRCGGLFYDGYADKQFQNTCSEGGGSHLPSAHNYVLPYVVDDDLYHVLPHPNPRIQANWRYCVRCGVLFYNGYRHTGFPGVCPLGGGHAPLGFNFLLLYFNSGDDRYRILGDHDPQRRADWRYCNVCAGLFWNGTLHKGLCPGSAGGGFHLHVVRTQLPDPPPDVPQTMLEELNVPFWKFEADPPVGITTSLEPASAAFSHGGRMFVFTGVGNPHWCAQTRSGDPAEGIYLVSTCECRDKSGTLVQVLPG